MFATLLALGLTLSAVQSDEFSAEVRLLSSTKYTNERKHCDLLISRSPELWKKGGFRTCHVSFSIETEEGDSITSFTITVNMTNIKNFVSNGTNVDKYAFINRKLNLNAQSCATVTGPKLKKTLSRFPATYSVEINVHTTAANQEDLSCTIIISNIRNASPLLKPVDCKHETTHSEIAQRYHQQFEVNMQMPDTNDRPATEAVLLQLLWIQRMLEFARSNCTPISVPAYDTELKIWNFAILLNENRASTINCTTIREHSPCLPKSCKPILLPTYKGSQFLHVQYEDSLCGQLIGSKEDKEVAFFFNSFWNGMHTQCPVIQYKKTMYAFHKGHYTALVSGPSHMDVCQRAENQKQYSGHLCEEVHKVNITSAVKSQRIFRMRPKEQIYLSDIPWYMNEHSKFVNYLNSRNSRCKFNGYVQLNESEFIPGVPCHTSRPQFK